MEQMLWAPKTHHDILYRMLRTRQKAAPRRSPESWGAQNVPRNCAGKCRNAAGGRTVCAAAGARWEDRRQHSQPAAVSITLCTALPACGREHHPVYSTPGVRPFLKLTQKELHEEEAEFHRLRYAVSGGLPGRLCSLPRSRTFDGTRTAG